MIDDYSLRGAKGLLVNITGGKDITLFEVDQAVNKIRAEVDPEAELVTGAIQDETLAGKMRVSIVATSLEGSALDVKEPESRTVLNMVNKIQNRNTGYSDGLFPKNTNIETNPLSSIRGATALKLNEKIDLNKSEIDLKASESISYTNNDVPSGVSIESASYIEENSVENKIPEINQTQESVDEKEEFTPQLFSDEVVEKESLETVEKQENHNSQDEKLFDQDINENEEDFEIPAFLRRQKF